VTTEGAREKTDQEAIVIPVVQEELTVDKRTVPSGRGVRVTKTVSERAVVLDEPLLHDEVQIERTPIGREVSGANLPGIRREGDTLIVPVLEEVPVLAKRIMLVEEIRITRCRREVSNPQRLVLKTEHVSVEPLAAGGDDPAGQTTTESPPLK